MSVDAPFKTILTAYDGSPPARACARVSAACAHRWNARMILCYAIDAQRLLVPAAGTEEDIMATVRRDAAGLVGDALKECRVAGADCESTLRDEGAREGIIRAAAEAQADLIALGTHAKAGVARAFLGSVTEDVLRHSSVPVLTVRSASAGPGAFKDIVVAIDDSPCAAHGAELAFQIARADGGTLHLVYASPYGAPSERVQKSVDALQAVAERARSGVTAHTYDELGDAGSAICRLAERLKADLVVTGSHGRKGIVHAVLGSVAEAVVRNAPCPVLVRPFTGDSSPLTEGALG